MDSLDRLPHSDDSPDPGGGRDARAERIPVRRRSPGRWLLLIALLLPALLARLPLAHHDVEHYVGPDEAELVENVLEMLKTDDWDHRHRGYPALNFYLLRTVFEVGLELSPFASGPEDIPSIHRSFFYRIAREVSLVLSWCAALVAASICWRFGSFLSATMCGLLIAYSPLIFRESRVVNPDLFLLFFASISLLLTLRALQSPTSMRFAVAGLGAALAMSAKYTGGALLAASLLAWWLAVPRRTSSLAALLGSFLATFFILNPFVIANVGSTSLGVSHHFNYYAASDGNAAWELLRVGFGRGVGPVAFITALASGALVPRSVRRPVIVVASLAAVVLVVFLGFGRAFPRHAIVLVLPLAILAGWGAGAVGARASFRRWRAPWILLLLAAVPQGERALSLSVAAMRPSPAERAHAWAIDNLPPGARVLQDQFTPSWHDRFEVYRFRVDDRVFPGHYDWVMRSGYPPGLQTRGLREVAHFETGDSLGAGIDVFQVPDRESLMGTTLEVSDNEVRLRAGQQPYFGAGWSKPQPGAFATSRLSTGREAEIFFVVADPDPVPELELELRVALATGRDPLPMELELNGGVLASFVVSDDTPEALTIRSTSFRRGLNELTLVFDETRRMNRRNPMTAVRFYELAIRRTPGE